MSYYQRESFILEMCPYICQKEVFSLIYTHLNSLLNVVSVSNQRLKKNPCLTPITLHTKV